MAIRAKLCSGTKTGPANWHKILPLIYLRTYIASESRTVVYKRAETAMS